MFTLAGELTQDIKIPPDKSDISTTDTRSYSHSKSTVKISSSGNSRVFNRKLCKYIRAKQVCPFDVRCHFRHDVIDDNQSDTPILTHSNFNEPTSSGCGPSPARPHSHDDPPQRQKRRPRPRKPRQHSGHPPLKPTPLQSQDAKILSTLEELHVTKEAPILKEKQKHTSHLDELQSKPLSSYSQDCRSRGPSELSLGSFLTPSLTRPPVQRPRPKKATKSSAPELREVELQQLEVRFPDCVLLEKGREQTVYGFSYQPAHPEWDFSFNSLTFEASFPGDYPLAPLVARISNHKSIAHEALEHINHRLQHHLTTEWFQSDTLMFRPFLRWLERNIVAILKEFISPLKEPQNIDIEDCELLSEGTQEGEDVSDEEEVITSAVTTVPIKAGTEIRLVGLSLSQSVATVTFTTPKIVVACGRCKHQEDVNGKSESAVNGSCSRCQCVFTLVYHPTLVHASSPTLGYMDMVDCSVVDLVLLDCALSIVCLDCGHDNQTKSMLYGQAKDFWCRKCHSKLSIAAEQCRFIKHQSVPINVSGEAAVTRVVKAARIKDPVFKLGHPLPDSGTCAHYKKSHRWLRFPCCGKVYPCDVCHDLSESHIMERAKRMICGLCSLEQVYSSSKPCSGCGSDMTSSNRTAYWEGGKGCRSTTKMNRRDKHKYSNSSQKTASQKAKRVGKQEKA